jgi:hypothetical protein
MTRREYNEYAVICSARDGTKSVWLYDIRLTSQDGYREWHVRAWPQDARHPEDGGDWYDIVIAEVNDTAARIVMVQNNLPATFHGRGLAPALYPLLARRLERTLESSRTSVADTSERRADRATDIWRYLVSIGEAGYAEGQDIYYVEGRPGHSKATSSRPVPLRRAPSSEIECDTLFEEIDRDFTAKNLAIEGRPLRAVGELSRLLAAEFSIRGASDKSPPRGFEGDHLVTRLSRWYDERYGGRLLVDFSPGSVVIMLRGDTWLLKLPMLYGRFDLVARKKSIAEKDIAIATARNKTMASAPMTYDVLDAVVGLPQALRESLTAEEIKGILFHFQTGMNAFALLRGIQKLKYIPEVRADLEAAVQHLSGKGRRHPGLSRWSSLQAVEKIYKAFLALTGSRIPKNHDLEHLTRIAEKAGLPQPDLEFIHQVQCDAGIRYGESSTSLVEAVTAHHASLDLIWYVGEELKRLSA